MHDYQISWDYMTDDFIDLKHVKVLNRIVKEIKKDILPSLKAFKGFSVHPIILADEVLGVYCKGTYSKPVIGVDIGNIIKASEQYGLEWKDSLRTTILHELKHGEQDFNNRELDEIEAEDFAFNNR